MKVGISIYTLHHFHESLYILLQGEWLWQFDRKISNMYQCIWKEKKNIMEDYGQGMLFHGLNSTYYL